MNQNYYNNEIEVYDSEMCQPRYPLVEAPVSECGCMDYQSVMNMSDGKAYVEQQGVVTNAITTSFEVIRTLYKSNKGAISTAGGIIKSILIYLWKRENIQQQWEEFMQSVEILINQKIDTAVMAAAISRVAGLEAILSTHQDYLDNLAADPSNPALQEIVRDHVITVHDFFVYTMPQLSQSPYQVQQLVAYAEAANLHLAFLRDVAMFGSQWGMDMATMKTYLGYLKTNIRVYTDYCVNTYNAGLEQTKNLMNSINPQDYNKYPYLNPHANSAPNNYKKVLQWNVWNDFRRNMTIMVLDLVVVWPTYDPEVYTNLEGVEIELSREVYSTSYNRYGSSTHGGDWKSWEILETSVVRPPHLVSFLSSLDFYLKNYANAPTNTGMDQYDGVINKLRNIDSTSTWEDGFALINKKEYDILKTVPGDYINGINITSGMNPCYLSFTTNSSGTHGVGGTCNRTPVQSPLYNLSATVPYHRLSYVNGMDDNFSGYYSNWGISAWGFGWLHESLKTSNIIHATRSSFIPAVKGTWIENTSGGTHQIRKGTGSTGGDFVQLIGSSSGEARLHIGFSQSGTKSYQIKLRYGSTTGGRVRVANAGVNTFVTLKKTYSSDLPKGFNEFQHADLGVLTLNGTKPGLIIVAEAGTNLVLDRIEFIPIQGTVEEYEAKQKLEKARKAVGALFTNDAKNTLRLDVTDYDVNQAACRVYDMSDDVYLKEKMCLLDQVKHAKRLSQTRNLLNYGDFESPYWLGEHGWQANNNVTVDNSYCNGRYLNMPGASVIGGNVVPTYVYQKVDESKLKPYTRYLVRGFVRNSKELELFVSRYGKEVHANFPLNLMDTCNQTSFMTNKSEMIVPLTNGIDEEKQNFVFHIDVGEINQRAGLGIGVGFKISSPSGMAQLDNIEVIEANPLTGEALARVKKREQEWKREMEQKCTRVEPIVIAAIEAVDPLFIDARKNRLKPNTTMGNIVNAERKLKAIPYVYDSVFEDVPGMNYAISQQLQLDIDKAVGLYNNKNMIQNGNFSNGLSNWNATAGADVQEQDGNPHVLVISQWEANVSQEVCVQPERGYVLRVTARKEGSGKGYVTLTDCTADNTETVTFLSDERVSTPRPSVRPERSVEPGICDTASHYSESFGIIPDYNNEVRYPTETYKAASCSCGCGTCGNTPSTSSQAKAYASQSSMPKVTGSSPSYITKTIEIFPETNRLRIEIGETGGTFLIDSIELICMED